MKFKKIVFFHIPKTAGTTLRWLIELNEGNRIRKMYHHEENQAKELVEDLKRSDEGFWMGHFKMNSALEKKDGVLYFAMFRDPVEQVVSSWLHYSRSVHEGHISIKNTYKTFEEYIHSEIAQNFQCQRLSSLYPGEVGMEKVIENALYNFEHLIDVPLVTSDFEKASIILGRLFKWKFWSYVNRNRVADFQVEEKKYLLDRYSQQIIQNNQGDIELYKRAKLKQEALFKKNGNPAKLYFEFYLRKVILKVKLKAKNILRF